MQDVQKIPIKISMSIKKKSNGKVDMVVSLINSIYLLEQEFLFGTDNFVVQVV